MLCLARLVVRLARLVDVGGKYVTGILRKPLALLVLFLVASCGGGGGGGATTGNPPPPYSYTVPGASGDGWAVASLTDEGMDEQPITTMMQGSSSFVTLVKKAFVFSL